MGFFDPFDVEGIFDSLQAGGDFGEEFLRLRILRDFDRRWYRSPDQVVFFENRHPVVEIAHRDCFVNSIY